MGSRTGHERRTGWRTVLDPEWWRQALLVGTAGAASMAILACAVALARDTTGHDWYAAARLTAAELLIAVGFDETAPTEYRTAKGAVETVSRYGLTVTLEARWAREDIVAAAWDGAMLGALSGLGGALLCLVLIRRPRDERRARRPAYEPAPAQRPEARERLVSPQERPEPAPTPVSPGFAPQPPAPAAPAHASTERRSASESPRPSKPEPAGQSDAGTGSGTDGAAAPARRKRRKRDHGRWI